MEARNRKLADWYGKILRGEIRLPRFQRFEAWDRDRIGSLITTVIRNLPLGITPDQERRLGSSFRQSLSNLLTKPHV